MGFGWEIEWRRSRIDGEYLADVLERVAGVTGCAFYVVCNVEGFGPPEARRRLVNDGWEYVCFPAPQFIALTRQMRLVEWADVFLVHDSDSASRFTERAPLEREIPKARALVRVVEGDWVHIYGMERARRAGRSAVS